MITSPRQSGEVKDVARSVSGKSGSDILLFGLPMATRLLKTPYHSACGWNKREAPHAICSLEERISMIRVVLLDWDIYSHTISNDALLESGLRQQPAMVL